MRQGRICSLRTQFFSDWDRSLDSIEVWESIDKTEERKRAARSGVSFSDSTRFPLSQDPSSLRMKEAVCSFQQNPSPVANNSFQPLVDGPSYRHSSFIRENQSRTPIACPRVVNFSDPPVSHMYSQSPPATGVMDCRGQTSHPGVQRMDNFRHSPGTMANSFCGVARPGFGASAGATGFMYSSPDPCARLFSQNPCVTRPNIDSFCSQGFYPHSRSAPSSSTRMDHSLVNPMGSGNSCNNRFAACVSFRPTDSGPSSSYGHQNHQNFSNCQQGFNADHSSGSGSRFSGIGSHSSANSGTGYHPTIDSAVLSVENAVTTDNKPELIVRESTEKEVLVLEWVNKYLPAKFARRYYKCIFNFCRYFNCLGVHFNNEFTFLLYSPRIVKINKRYAVHRNFGLSMQVGGYVHGYVMDVFTETLMQEQYDNTEHYDQRRPRFLKYMMNHEAAVRFFAYLVLYIYLFLFCFFCFLIHLFIYLSDTVRDR